jgi:hypothetical protein
MLELSAKEPRATCVELPVVSAAIVIPRSVAMQHLDLAM